MSEPNVYIKLYQEDIEGIKRGKVKSYSLKRPTSDDKGINIKIWQICLTAILLFSLIISGFLAVCIKAQSQKTDASKKIGLMVEINSDLYEFTLLNGITYYYIESNKTITLRKKPIIEEWQRMFEKLTTVQADLLKITDAEKGIGPNAKITEFLTGNLCGLVPLGLVQPSLCPTLLNGAVAQGVINANAALLRIMQRMKLDFDSSERQMADMIRIIDNFEIAQTETATLQLVIPGYVKIGDLIKEQLDDDLERDKEYIKIIVIIYLVVYLALWKFMWYALKEVVERERSNWRKMIRLFPHYLMANNKLFQSYFMVSNQSLMN